MENSQNLKPKLIAHRGNSSQAPENTLAAFIQAIRVPVDFIECDVQLSKEGVPVVFHDGTLQRITRDHNMQKVDELTLEEIKEIDAGSWFDESFSNQRIITLEELLRLPRGKIGIMLEVKEETFIACSMGKQIGDVIKKMAPYQRNYGPIIIGSLSPNVLLCLEAYMPQQPLIPIVRDLNDLSDFGSLHAKHYAFKYSLLTKELIEKFHHEGIQVWAWTIDDKDTAYELVGMGLDGIITNHPKKMVSLCHPSRESVSSLALSIFDQLVDAGPKKRNQIFKQLKKSLKDKKILFKISELVSCFLPF